MITLTKSQIEFLYHADEMLSARMASKKKRYIHSTLVAKTACKLADLYDVNVFDALTAGLLHDWDKVLENDDLLMRATKYGINLGDAPLDCLPLLHGPVASYELPHIFPEVSSEITHAIAVHTTGCLNMTPLDMVIFVADAIEPNRNGESIETLRNMAGNVCLEELFFQTFVSGLVYVLKSRRHLYKGALPVYNAYAERRNN